MDTFILSEAHSENIDPERECTDPTCRWWRALFAVGATARLYRESKTRLVIGLWFYGGSLASASVIGRAAMAR